MNAPAPALHSGLLLFDDVTDQLCSLVFSRFLSSAPAADVARRPQLSSSSYRNVISIFVGRYKRANVPIYCVAHTTINPAQSVIRNFV